METSKVIYLVGDKNSPKTNSWLFMTASKEAAQHLLNARGTNGTMKEVKLPRKGE